MRALLGLLLGAALAAADPGLRDHPFLGDSITRLDSAWTASTQLSSGPPPAANCSFLAGVDYDTQSQSGEHTGVASRQDCCNLCAVDPYCAAAVYPDEGNTCWFKTAAQLAKKTSRPGRAACVVQQHTTPPPGQLLTIPAQVPGDLVSDLYNAGVVGDPLYMMNFKNSSIWDDYRWTYATTFELPPAQLDGAGETILVFDGVKMGAHIILNGKEIGQTTDQFLRYNFPLKSSGALRAGSNRLEVTFDKAIECDGRWMACTGGWDWAAYTTTTQEGAQTFTKGIWKHVYLVPVTSAAISHVVPHTFYKGPYPAAPIAPGRHGGFEVRVRLHLWAPAPVSGTVAVSGAWGEQASAPVSVPAGDSNVTLTLTASAKQVELWWPAGLGSQPLYNVSATFTPAAGGAAVSAQRRIGFRTFAIVTGNDTDPQYVKDSEGADGTSALGMLFRVNGAAIFSRGANMIPMEELEGRLSGEAHRRLVRSAADAKMNTLRVWGGGIFLPDEFYDACDEYGILLYHDMQFAQRGHSPKETPTQAAEFRHQVRRLSHHPSIAIWDGCNECHVVIGTATGIYATFVLTVVTEEDQMRSVWPSCPAEGWSSGVHRLTSQPNGSPLGLNPQFLAADAGRGARETHGPYQHSNLWKPPVNKGDYDPNRNPVPLTVKPGTATGPGAANVFASEFGAVVMSSFESMAPTLAPEHWALHGGAPDAVCPKWPCDGYNPMAERNYGCGNMMKRFFGDNAAADGVLNTTGAAPFKRQLYQCMLSQGLEMKANIEQRRAGNQFGIIVWQYNEIWPTGGWGSIEYGTPVAGQVIGGRWKPLQYFYMNHLYADVILACGLSWCYVKNDGVRPFQGTALVQKVTLATGATAVLKNETLALAAGAGVTQWLPIDTSGVDTATEIVTAAVLDAAGATVSHNVATLTVPAAMKPPKATVTTTVSPAVTADGTVSIEVEATGGVALYVVLTTAAHGRFSDNAFALNGKRTVSFLPFRPGQEAALRQTLRVEHLAQNMA
eukprot:TRINITY_DN163_c0_g1_i1.p1 TRINITY_DN163_c0_g1~~TRINITY_DN163_c0_g1_i1.p1  ORF type:complete len:1043 (+),score=341.75 TRINITY_DN163_c0_g1_i1:110-3130(+)